VTQKLSDPTGPERLHDMTKHRYLITSSVEPLVTLKTAAKVDAFVIARALAASENAPVFVEDHMAHLGQENRWRVAPYDKFVKTIGFKARQP
jgi:hypothetical protein